MRNSFTISDILKGPTAHLNQHLVKEKPKKKSKYNNVKVEFDDKVFDSIKERDRYISLRMLLVAGEIKDLLHHVTFRLESNDVKICDYEADFTYVIVKTGEMIVEDVKSVATRRIRLYIQKKKLMQAQYNITIKEV